MMMRRQIAVALTGIIAGNTVLFAQAASTEFEDFLRVLWKQKILRTICL